MIWLFLLMYVLPFLVLTVLVEAEFFGWATFAMIVSISISGCLHYADILPFVKMHGLYCLEGILAYVAAGVTWSFIKWFLFLMKFRSIFRDFKIDYVKTLGLPAGSNVPEDKLKDFKNQLGFKHVNGYSLTEVPSAADSKGKIVAWMAFWPCSIIGYVFNDPVRRLFNAIFMALKNSYQKMANHIISDPELK